MITTQDKSTLRKSLKKTRSEISPLRREQASTFLKNDLLKRLKPFRAILSFASKGDEIDLWQINRQLSREGRLLLPKVDGDLLEVYAVDEIDSQLALSNLSILEPIPHQCRQVPYELIDCILVPGLGFDEEKRRIGYGKGHYDRLLKVIKEAASSAVTIGIAFEEQLVAEQIPTEMHDLPVDQLLLC